MKNGYRKPAILTWLMLAICTLKLSAQVTPPSKFKNRIWIGTEIAWEKTYYPNTEIVYKTHRLEYAPISLGLQMEPWLRIYAALEFNYFRYQANFNNYDFKRHSDPAFPYSLEDATLIYKFETQKKQRIIFPTFWAEFVKEVTPKFYMGLAVGIGSYKTRFEYRFESISGYGGNEVDGFNDIEVNTLETFEHKHTGQRGAFRYIMEWRTSHFQLAGIMGLQVVRYIDRDIKGHSNFRGVTYNERSAIDPYRSFELSAVYGIRLSCFWSR